jgi:hypothetical protein
VQGASERRTGPACCAGEHAFPFLCWAECRRARGERASGASMRCSRGTLDGPSALIAGGLAVSALRPCLLDVPRHAWPPRRRSRLLDVHGPRIACVSHRSVRPARRRGIIRGSICGRGLLGQPLLFCPVDFCRLCITPAFPQQAGVTAAQHHFPEAPPKAAVIRHPLTADPREHAHSPAAR